MYQRQCAKKTKNEKYLKRLLLRAEAHGTARGYGWISEIFQKQMKRQKMCQALLKCFC
jgi:hypothetical protein